MLASDALTAMTGRRKAGPAAALLLALLAVAGCAGIEPYKPHNNREEGPEKGLLTGDEGEFVIFRYEDAPKSEEEPEGGTAESDTASPE
ncbi:MAG: hypothetical protein OEM93_00605 [Rhodospirillales bacterium]|nr:hypothetical protein [Rhodospirillales bacterium]MDH3790116.1 hypothetical protein [Rhodospirillales bacterium]MDH3918726.1 hypothetical protein [Rhodospirillales bacterium]MDH3968509.1 hypothetical protein [Rhodospirillales bacterium]